MEIELVDSVPQDEPAVAPAPVDPAPVTPSPTEQPPEPATPVVEPAVEAPAATPAPEEKTYKLPDGREVDAAGLQKEYENLLPEFTRRSQRLAELERGTTPQQPITKEEPAWKNPDFSPSNWAEAIEIAKQAALEEIAQSQETAKAQEAALRTQVETQIAEIKASDPTLDENALFEHAVKYGFQDLKVAHSNYKAIQEVALTTEQRVLKNLSVRAADPIATTPTPAPVVSADEIVAGGHSNFRGALDFLDALKAKNN